MTISQNIRSNEEKIMYWNGRFSFLFLFQFLLKITHNDDSTTIYQLLFSERKIYQGKKYLKRRLFVSEYLPETTKLFYENINIKKFSTKEKLFRETHFRSWMVLNLYVSNKPFVKECIVLENSRNWWKIQCNIFMENIEWVGLLN